MAGGPGLGYASFFSDGFYDPCAQIFRVGLYDPMIDYVGCVGATVGTPAVFANAPSVSLRPSTRLGLVTLTARDPYQPPLRLWSFLLPL